MGWAYELRSRWRKFVHRADLDRDLDDELSFPSGNEDRAKPRTRNDIAGGHHFSAPPIRQSRQVEGIN